MARTMPGKPAPVPKSDKLSSSLNFINLTNYFRMTQRTLRGTRLKKVRTSGFRARMSSKTGRRVINARRKKGRAKLTV